MKLPVLEVALVEPALELKLALPRLLALEEVSCVLYRIIVPRLSAEAVLEVVLPRALVHAAVGVDEHAQAVSLSVAPFALVYVAISMGHPSLSIE